MRLPPFWPKRPDVWFAQAEVQFTLAVISSEQTKFSYVISQLDQRYASEVEDIITCPPEWDPYTTLRTELVRQLSPSKEHRICELRTLEMGDRKPSQFLRHLRSLAPDMPEVSQYMDTVVLGIGSFSNRKEVFDCWSVLSSSSLSCDAASAS
jgi:hypothetical protein